MIVNSNGMIHEINCRIGQSFILDTVKTSSSIDWIDTNWVKSGCELCKLYSNCYSAFPYMKCEKQVKQASNKNWWWTFNILKRVY
jgi:hypothetical protein